MVGSDAEQESGDRSQVSGLRSQVKGLLRLSERACYMGRRGGSRWARGKYRGGEDYAGEGRGEKGWRKWIRVRWFLVLAI